MRNGRAARTTADAIAKAGHASKTRLGDERYVLGRRQAVVLWRQGTVVSAIVLQSPLRRKTVRRVALAHVRVAESHVTHAVTVTGWEHVRM
jgi:hypothetical protein